MPVDNRIKLVYSIATFIYNEASNLVGAGSGEDIHGRDLGTPPVIDGIPIDTEEYRWADACIRLLRYIAQAMAISLEEEQENMLAADPFADTEFEDITDSTNNEETNI